MRKTLAVILLLIAVSPSTLTQTMDRRFNYVQPATISVGTAIVKEAALVQKTQEIKVYLVALNDDGYQGNRIGCGDSLVAVRRTINKSATPLKAALEELLAMPQEFERDPTKGNLGNYVFGPELKLSSVSISKGTATIHFSGHISVAGICDEPRIVEQIEATARQFPTVKRVKVFVGKETLAEAIS
jgi:spore germination protein GerM